MNMELGDQIWAEIWSWQLFASIFESMRMHRVTTESPWRREPLSHQGFPTFTEQVERKRIEPMKSRKAASLMR